MNVHVCTFEAVGSIAKKTSYKGFRKKVLQAGRFSVFEATATDRIAKLYTRLCSDPEIETDTHKIGYPWTLIRWAKKEVPE